MSVVLMFQDNNQVLSQSSTKLFTLLYGVLSVVAGSNSMTNFNIENISQLCSVKMYNVWSSRWVSIFRKLTLLNFIELTKPLCVIFFFSFLSKATEFFPS